MDNVQLGNFLIRLLERDPQPDAQEAIRILRQQIAEIEANGADPVKPEPVVVGLKTIELKARK